MNDKIELNVYQRLILVQQGAVAPREISGKFGKGRSAEQILEAYKPICNKHGLFLNTTDTISQVGDRNYITATAYVTNVDKPEEQHFASATAWEGDVPISNSGNAILDTSQVSGKTSSYAKKYALQNLFAIDDTKDADIEDHHTQAPKKAADIEDHHTQAPKKAAPKPIPDPLAVAKDNLMKLLAEQGHDNPVKMKLAITKVLNKSTVDTIEESNEVVQALEDGAL